MFSSQSLFVVNKSRTPFTGGALEECVLSRRVARDQEFGTSEWSLPAPSLRGTHRDLSKFDIPTR